MRLIKEFLMMKGRFSNYEARYHYGKFLSGAMRVDDAKIIFNEILGETVHLNAGEKRQNRKWFNLAKEEMKSLEAARA